MSGHRLIDALATSDAVSDAFSDGAVLRAMLDFEVALARVEARAGIIPIAAADAIAAAAQPDGFDAAAIAREARTSATVSIPLVAALTARVRASSPDSAAYVHWGATSQDVTDTALVLLLARVRPVLAVEHGRLSSSLRRLSDAHAETIMLGRTLMQPATPITFGLKAAVWYSTAARGWKRLARAFDDSATVQFGGAAGTLAVLGEAGPEIGRKLANELGLLPSLPWHTDRAGLADVVSACGLYTGGLGKIARDVALLAQPEVGEVAAGGGGSSTMPHKQNPAGCAIALAAATRLPGIVAGFLAGTSAGTRTLGRRVTSRMAVGQYRDRNDRCGARRDGRHHRDAAGVSGPHAPEPRCDGRRHLRRTRHLPAAADRRP